MKLKYLQCIFYNKITGQIWNGLLYRHYCTLTCKSQGDDSWGPQGWGAGTGCMAQPSTHLLVTPASRCGPRGSRAPARTCPLLPGSCSNLLIGTSPKPEQALHVAGGDVHLAARDTTGAPGLSSTTKRESDKHRLDWIVSSAKIRGIFQGSLRNWHLNPPVHLLDRE